MIAQFLNSEKIRSATIKARNGPLCINSPQFLTQIIQKIIFHSNLAYMPPSIVAFSLLSASDRHADAEDVDKTFNYLLYLLKQDPDDNDDDFTH